MALDFSQLRESIKQKNVNEDARKRDSQFEQPPTKKLISTVRSPASADSEKPLVPIGRVAPLRFLPGGVIEGVIGRSQYAVEPRSGACASIAIYVCLAVLYAVDSLAIVDYVTKTVRGNSAHVDRVVTSATNLWKVFLGHQPDGHRFVCPTEILRRSLMPLHYVESFEEHYGIVGRTDANFSDCNLRPLCSTLRDLAERTEDVVVAVLTAFNASYALVVRRNAARQERSFMLIDSHPKRGTTLYATNTVEQFYRMVLWVINVPQSEWAREMSATAVSTAATHAGRSNVDISKGLTAPRDSMATASDQYELCVIHPQQGIVFAH